jgi:hypothetical protein
MKGTKTATAHITSGGRLIESNSKLEICTTDANTDINPSKRLLCAMSQRLRTAQEKKALAHQERKREPLQVKSKAEHPLCSKWENYGAHQEELGAVRARAKVMGVGRAPDEVRARYSLFLSLSLARRVHLCECESGQDLSPPINSSLF